MRREVVSAIISTSFILIAVFVLSFVLYKCIPMVESSEETGITVIAAGGDDHMSLMKAGGAWVPIHRYKGYIIYNDNRYSINGERAYSYCMRNKGLEVPAILIEHTYTNGKTGIEIKLKLD